VRETWITNVLEHSLHHAAWIDLHLQDQPDALENPWQFVVQELNTTPRSLPTGTNIFQIYDDSQGQLLILGEPGAGKTTLLLQLARTLLDLAKDDEQRPLPVVFQLSTWAAWARAARKRNSLFSFGKWLIDELELRYGVPPEVANQWVEGHQLVFLLDGLDEVAAEERSACVEAIIAYQRDSQRQVTTNLVICCRSQEFEELVRPLPLFTAVNILPLSDEQVDAYLSSAQGQLDGLRHLLQINAEFAELARRPLVLSIATLAFEGKRVVNFPSENNFPAEDNFPVASPSQEQLLQIVFTTYVERMLSRRGKLPSWIQPASFLSWLSFLARQLQARQQTEFSLDILQANWLSGVQKSLYRWSIRLFVWLVGVVIGGLAGGLLVGLISGLFIELAYLFYSTSIGDFLYDTLGVMVEAVAGDRVAELLGMVFYTSRKATVMELAHVQGIRSAAMDSLFGNLLGGPLLGLLAGIVGLVVAGPIGGIVGLVVGGIVGLIFLVPAIGLLIGTFVGLFRGLFTGPLILIENLFVRFFLWKSHTLPWRLETALNEAATRLLMHKSGNQYLFIHRFLLDYFAALDEPIPPSVSDTKRTAESPPSGV